MDLEILFWLVILLAPVLSRLLRGKKQKQKTSSPPVPRPDSRPQQARSTELTPFEEALRQIQEALAEGRTSDREPERRPEPKAQPQPERRPPTPRRLEKPPAEFQAPKPITTTPRFYDDKFDAAAPGTAPGRKEHYHEPLAEDIPAVAISTRRRKRKQRSKWQKAIVNMVVLNGPRSRNPWSPKGHR